ncbi:MAG TPA: alpha/beta fold hydrolase [Acidobacteriaceae bacterium]
MSHETTFSHSAGFKYSPAPVYFDRLTPHPPARRPHVVMLHGGNHTGSCYLMTADERPGWAYRFVRRGYPVIVPDWPGHGRSGALNLDTLTGEMVCQGLASMIADLPGPVALVNHSMGGALGWRIAELCGNQITAIIGVAPGPPGNIQPAPEVLSETDDTVVLRTPFRTLTLNKRGAIYPDRSFVEDKLIGSSQQFPRERIDAYASLLTPVGSRLLYERLNVRMSQVRIQNTTFFADKPVMIVTGSDDLEHPRAVDKVLGSWLAECGVATRLAWLPDQNINGNGHMMMMERNSDQIADFVLDWLGEHIAS